MSLIKRLLLAVVGLAIVYSVTLWTLTTTVDKAGYATPVEVVAEFDRVTFDERNPRAAVMQYVAEDFVDHDPETGGTRAGLLKLLEAGGRWSVAELKREKLHTFVDGAVIAIHQRIVVRPGEPAAEVVDLFRVDKGKIVEHWGVAQAAPAGAGQQGAAP